jgi:hypothetical protein
MMRKLLVLVLLPALLLQWFPDTLHSILHDENHAHTVDFATAEDSLSEAHVHCNHDEVLWMPAALHEGIWIQWMPLILTRCYLPLETSAESIEAQSIGGRAPPEMI